MASGRKNYFRHSFFARNDDFINDLMENFGLQGYYYYFALIEMCGEQSAESIQKVYSFHKRTLIHSLRLNTRKLNLFLTYLQDKFRISYVYSGSTYEIIFPNIAKYLGSYLSKNDKGKERKVKESKVKESKVKESSTQKFSTERQEIIDYFNATIKTKYKPESLRTVSLLNKLLLEYSIDEIKSVINKKARDWLNTKYKVGLTPKKLFGHDFEIYIQEANEPTIELRAEELLGFGEFENED